MDRPRISDWFSTDTLMFRPPGYIFYHYLRMMEMQLKTEIKWVWERGNGIYNEYEDHILHAKIKAEESDRLEEQDLGYQFAKPWFNFLADELVFLLHLEKAPISTLRFRIS